MDEQDKAKNVLCFKSVFWDSASCHSARVGNDVWERFCCKRDSFLARFCLGGS